MEQKKPSKQAATDAERRAAAEDKKVQDLASGKTRVVDPTGDRRSVVNVVRICPVMSGGIMIGNAPVSGKPDMMTQDIVVPGSVPAMAPVMVPCQERQCALAVGDDEFGFVGCGLVTSQTVNALAGADVGNALDRLRDDLTRVLGAGPGLAAGMIAMQGAVLELKQMLGTVGIVHSEITKQTAAVTKLINHLIDRMQKPAKPPAPPRSPAPPKGNPPIGAVH